MLPKNVETLESMNASTGKYAKWHVRVIDPKGEGLQLRLARRESSGAKCECVLASQDPSQHMMGLVPFEFKNRRAACNAEKTVRPNDAWEVTMPASDAKAKPEFDGCPAKAVLLLKAPRN